MQAKKRAKSVKFGKQQEKKKAEREIEAEGKELKGESKPQQEQTVDTAQEVKIDSPQPLSTTQQSPQLQSNPQVMQPATTQSEGEVVQGPQIPTPNPQLQSIPDLVSPLSITPQPAQPANTAESTSQFQTVQPIMQTTVESENKETNTIEENGPEKKKNLVRFFLLVALLAFLIGLAFLAGIYYAMQNKNLSLSHIALPVHFLNKPSPTKSVTAAVPTPVVQKAASKSADLSSYTIEILNGSGTAGEAAKVKDQLITAGYKVESIGNADRSDYTKTQLFAKKSVDTAYLDSLNKELAKKYVVETESSLPSAISSNADVIITIGSSKKQ